MTNQVDASRPPWQSLPRGFLRASLIDNAALAGLVLIYGAAVFLAALTVGRVGDIALDLYTAWLAGVVFVTLLLWLFVYLLYVVFVVRPLRPVVYICQRTVIHLHWRERLLQALPMLVILPLFLSLFTSMKNLIPVLNPYQWDPVFTRWDRWLGGGREPWHWFSFLFRWPDAIYAINFLYNFWFLIMYGLLLWQMFSLRDRHLRLQFLLAYLLSWMILGSVLAIALSSAGPCFYAQVVGIPDPYALLMANLHEVATHVSVWALPVQESLWENYVDGHLQLGSGISAMPSMHLADGLLFALLAWRAKRPAGAIMYGYLVILWVGSILLAWHYLVDGIVAFAGTTLIWALAGWLSRCIQRVALGETPIYDSGSVGD